MAAANRKYKACLPVANACISDARSGTLHNTCPADIS